jgi:hypothetical protein
MPASGLMTAWEGNMPKLAAPLTDLQVKDAKPKDKLYTLPDGGGMYLEVAPSGSKTWRMSYRQPNGKNTRLSFGAYPEVSLLEARKKRMEAKKMRAAGSDLAQAIRDKRQAVDAVERHTFELVAREWLQKTAAGGEHQRQGDGMAGKGRVPVTVNRGQARRRHQAA